MNEKEYNLKILQELEAKRISFETEFPKILIDGAKSILFKDKKDFRIFTIRAGSAIDNKKVRKILNSQKLRFAKEEELLEAAGVVSGALPPFGRPFIEVDHYLDAEVLKGEYIAFNAAIIGHRIRLRVSDYLKLVNPTICDFQKVC